MSGEACSTASGTITADSPVTVTTINYMQNLTCPFSVIWVDNNNPARPTLGQGDFTLQYRTSEIIGGETVYGEWTDLTEASLEALDIDQLPTFDASQAASGEYTYRGLPSIDKEGKTLSYRVVPTAPAGYTVSANDENNVFTFRKTMDFSATVSWLDSGNEEGKRPERLPLKLYRRAGNGAYKEVDTALAVKDNEDNTWSVSAEGLTRYADSDQEYDYVLVQGTIGENGEVTQTPISDYATYYHNGSGNFSSDAARCHNGGTITQRLTGSVSFTAKKEWEDNGKEERPNATVTLWRYAIPSTGDTGIDRIYIAGNAAQVIYRKTNADGSYQDVLLSYPLNKSAQEAIAFTNQTIPALPEGFQLPAYDEQGRKYVYFVRETVDSDNYEITYSGGNEGAGNHGTITNTRREKAKINVTKIWQSPSNLPDIEGASVQMKILAPDSKGNLQELTVYSSTPNSYDKLTGDQKAKAQTLSGFTENISSLDLQFYVNIYDENGLLYDMTNAVIQEIAVIKGDETISVTDGTFSLNGNTYQAASKYEGQTTLADGMQEFQYKQTNTITGTRDYTLVKKWNGFGNDELAKIGSVSFTLQRRSTKDGSEYETVGIYQVPAGSGTEWTTVIKDLPKYDGEGYAYQYIATETGVSSTENKPVVTTGWYTSHYRTEDTTTVTNYKGSSSGDQLFSVSKTWLDNGDVNARETVKVRVYRKADIAAALEGRAENDVISLGELSIGYAEYTLSVSGSTSWYCSVALSNVKGQIGNSENTSVEDYLTLEYRVGSGEPAQYPVSQLKKAAKDGNAYTVSGTVSTSSRQYRTLAVREGNDRHITITNTRIGQATLGVTKNWKDENNFTRNRPNSVQFRVYQDGQAYTPGADSGVGSISGDGAGWDCDTGIITVTANADMAKATQWTFQLEDLPLFSDAGVQRTYHLEEIGEETSGGEETGGSQGTSTSNAGTARLLAAEASRQDTESGSRSYYRSTKDNPTVTSELDRMNYAFSFTNTLAGTTYHAAHKSWKDTDTGGNDRPDLYLTLYRYLKADARSYPNTPVEELESYQAFTDCSDPVWYVDDACHWRAEVTDLPLYDEQGREYAYRFQETMNNEGKTVHGTYVQTAEYDVQACETCNSLNKTYLKPYDKFTNTLTASITVSGEKTWKGFEGYQIDPKDYPTPTIELYRSLTTVNLLNKSSEEIEGLVNDKTIELVASKTLTPGEGGRYFYSFTQEGEGLAGFNSATAPGLPKFDPEGRRYVYAIYERMPDAITDQLYTEESVSGTLTNTFRRDVNRRSIAVTKTWLGRDNLKDGEKVYPSITYTLYRYEKGADPENAKELQVKRVSAADVKANAETPAENRQPLCTFTDLLIYSPSGKQYCYYITEGSINGYDISYTDENGSDDSNGRSDVISVPENPFDENAEHVTQVGTTNTYSDPATMTLTGRKFWNDYGNSSLIYGNRPPSITITLKRYTQNESGQANRVTEEEIKLDSGETGKPYVEWEKSVEDNTDCWKYTICNLERYAPNGMPYIYTVTESPVEGYKQSEQPVTGSWQESTYQMNDLTNSLGGTYYVRKNWMDGNNKYGLRPTSITVVLERSKDGTTWEKIPWNPSFGTYNEATKKWIGLPSVTKDEQGNDIVSIKLTADYEKKNTGGNSWEYTFTNLPEQDQDGKLWHYRCIETHIGAAEVEKRTADGKTTYEAAAYTRTYPAQGDEKTDIQNKLESTTLHVEKIWVNDEDDLYHSRPDAITFVLQMRGIRSTGDAPESSPSEEENDSGEGSSEGNFELTDWQNVKVNGRDYTFTLTKGENWQKTLQDLPVATVGEDGKTYYTLYFRAEEVTAIPNYAETTDYGKDYSPSESYDESNPLPDHYYNTDLHRNESKITNKLIRQKNYSTITVEKVWRRQPGENATAVFELLYKTKDETNWHCYGGQTLPEDSGSWSGHTGDAGCVLQTVTSTDAGNTTVTWENLPQYDSQGNELVYKVVEHPVEEYRTEFVSGDSNQESKTLLSAFLSLFNARETTATYDTAYTFTNIQLQSYTVKKVWQNTDYAEKTDTGFTAEFQLQQKIGDGEWQNVEGKTCTLTSASANDTKSYTWNDLPKYTADEKGNWYEITYRAVETEINGKPVENDTNGSYIVTYQYDGGDSAAFAGTETVATNRMVYGFVNLSKAAAYLAPSVTADDDKKLAGVVFDIYSGTGASKTLYVSGIVTDANGNLTRNEDGTYGKEHKFLISGTYTLMERSTKPGYSVWSDGVTFTVGVNGGTTDTGEHGTAWIRTIGIGELVLALKAEYKPSSKQPHTFANSEGCEPAKDSNAPAYNLESRGVIEFNKTGSDGALDTHAGADGESKAYFGVYTDEACTDQVAGMMAGQNGITMVLTTRKADGMDHATEFLAGKNAAGLPYLRLENGQLTLLSGTYYIREKIAPPGYKLDTTVRMAVIPLLEKNSGETAYGTNKASILIPKEGTGTTDYQWVNVPNQLTLYKRDQYGRPVTLKDGGWLELKVEGEGNTFLTGENTIRLYQNSQNPAAKLDGAAFDAGKTPNITYDSDHWTITGLFDIGKTYTISEPEESVPGSHIQAKPFSFTMKADGSITYAQFEGRPELVSMDNPLGENGTNFENAFRSNTGSNVVVLRDVARFLKDVALEKINSVTNAMIPNISFKLYKYSGKDADRNPLNVTSVLEQNKFLTTDENGMIDLKDTNGYINQVTGCGLEHGLDVGEYYFEEIEQGASDIYRLVGRVYFDIVADNPENTIPTTQEEYEKYAKVVFTANGYVDQPVDTSGQLGKTGVVKNTPVAPKTLVLTKVDSANADTKLSGARFTLTYTSINDGQNGAQTVETFDCMTDINGVLCLCGADGAITSGQPDISKKGTYTLVETLAPYGYMTRTDGNGNPVTMVTFEVDSANQITNVTCGNGLDALVSHSISPADGEHTALNLTVKNEKTVVSIAKRNDIESDSKTSNQKSLNGEPLTGAVLEIYEGIGTTGADWTSPAGDYQLPAGTLKENTIYTLHEKEAPVGYLEADDIYFKLFGTTVKNGNVVSQLYVWTGNGEPALKGEWSKTTNLNDTVLTMVDEAVIAPVDLQKVVGDAISGYTALLGAVFEVRSLDGEGTVLGTAATNETGHLVWQTVTNPNGLIFNASGKRVTSGTDSSVIGKTIILRQNTNGYQFTETYAPDQAYNEGKSFTVKITAKNYTDYRKGGYRENVYVDILAANKMDTKTVENLTTRDNTPTADDLVNPPYKSTVTLHKYDGESGEARTPLEKTEFTLYRVENDVENLVTDANVPGGEPNASGKFVTGEDGDLSIEIHRKGDYILRETQAAPGYICDGEVSFTLTDADYGQKKAEPGDAGKVAYEVPNVPIKITITKVDMDDHDAKLAGVQFTLRPAEGKFLDDTTERTLITSSGSDGQSGETGESSGQGEQIGEIKIPAHLLQQNHSYILTETSVGDNTSYRLPEGESIRFNVKPDGTIALEEFPDGMCQVNPSDATNLTVFNTHLSLTITKKDQVTKSPLEGATLKLSKWDENKEKFVPFVLESVTNEQGSWTTDGTGAVTLKGTAFTPGRYQLEEVRAPDNYNGTDAVLTFTITQSGEITDAKVGKTTDATETPLTDSDLHYHHSNPSNGEAQIEVFNAAYSALKITKRGAGLDVSDSPLLKDVQFRLKYQGDTTKEPVTVVTDGNGEAVFENLPDGTYRVTEVKTAPGYNLLSAPIEVTISRDSDTYTARFAGEETEAELSRSGDIISLTVVNQKGLALPDTGTTTPELPKAVLLVTAALEGLVLYLYQTHGKRRKRED